MRKYQPVWEAIKQNGNACLVAQPEMQERIIKAVRKEKTMDVGWKLLNSEAGIRYKLKEVVSGNKVQFTLERDNSSYLADMKL
jgi:hypothetical protein